MASKGKRRAAARADKKRRKTESYKLGGKGKSTYAKKLRGERTQASLDAELRPAAFCAGCYMRRTRCRCSALLRERIAQLETQRVADLAEEIAA